MGMRMITPQTEPNHSIVGRVWVGWNGQIYYCDSYDPRLGYWMTNVADSSDRVNVSERAPRGTYHEVMGVCGINDISKGRKYLAVNLGREPFETVEVEYAQALQAKQPVFLFLEDWMAKRAVKRAEEAAKRRHEK